MSVRYIFSRWLILAVFLAVIQNSRAAFVGFEAESGVLGGDWVLSNSASPIYITITTTGAGGNPGSAARVATYTVTFPAAGKYELYARVRVGPDPFNDDSMFYADSFGTKSPTTDSDWVTVNGLGSGGFSNGTDIVNGGGSAGAGVWKWSNLSQRSPRTVFTVSGNLTRTFQIGAREDGLDLDKFVFGTVGYSFTVSNLDNGTDGTPPPSPPPSSTTIDVTRTFQTIEGMGGAIAFFNGWVTAHPFKQEIYTNAFAGLNLSMLRLGNWFRYQGTVNFDPDAPEFVSRANSILGHSVPVLMSSWAPPAFLKSNGQVGNGGTLVFTNGGFAYTNFAQYWYDALVAYGALGVSPTWISIQNEPDWEASYDSCKFLPAEGVQNGTNYAGYSNALTATFLRLTNLPSTPKILGPENVGLNGNSAAVVNFAAKMNPNHFYGVAHHLYGGSTDGTPDGYNTALSALTNIFPAKPRFMTEYGLEDMIDQANLIHNVLTVEQASGYNYWSLVWPFSGDGLIEIENPFDGSHASWTNAPAGTPTQSHGWWPTPAYWAMKHYSYFIQPGYKRVNTTCTDTNVLTSAYLSPDGLRLVLVVINRNLSPATNTVTYGSFPYSYSSVYQTAGTNNFQSLGPVSPQFILPASSLTTVVLDKQVTVGSATNPSPTNGETSVALSAALTWSPGSNALTHALFLGLNSNSVALATVASPEFQGTFSTNTVYPALGGSSNYFWRVDEIAGANTNTGVVWSFSTMPPPALAHRYSFSEASGSITADSIGGPAWTGTLPNGGTFSSGQLTLSSNASQYVTLPAGIVSALTNFTVEVWVKLNSTANWTRVFDFGRNTTTNMFLTPLNGSNSRVRFAITTSGSGGEQRIDGTSALSVGVWHHLAVTLKTNRGVLYVDGVPVGTNGSMTLKPASLGNTANNYLGKSQYSDPYMNGALDEFRIYNVALSPAEIAATFSMGPDQLLSSDSPHLDFSISPPNLTLAWPVASASFTLQSRTNLLAGTWSNVTSPAPQIIGAQWSVTIPVTNSDDIFYRLIK